MDAHTFVPAPFKGIQEVPAADLGQAYNIISARFFHLVNRHRFIGPGVYPDMGTDLFCSQYGVDYLRVAVEGNDHRFSSLYTC